MVQLCCRCFIGDVNLFVVLQVSEQEMDQIIARSTNKEKMIRNKFSSHCQGLIFTHTYVLLSHVLVIINIMIY